MPQDPKALTHEQMRKIVLGGGSVLHRGQVINNVNQLPPPEALIDNPDEQAKLLAELEAEETKLRERREALQGKSFEKLTKSADQSESADEAEFKRLAAEADAKAAADKKEEEAKAKRK